MQLPKPTLTDILKQQKVLILLFCVVIAMLMIGELLAPGFSSFQHIQTILRTASFVGLAAIGQTLVILTGGIDLTIASLITLGQIFGCLFVNTSDANLWWAILLILLIGGVFGLISGLGVSYLKISPLVMTLAVSSLVNGVTLISIEGAPRGRASPLLERMGAGSVAGMPSMVWIWLLLSAIVILFLRKTIVGRQIYHIGTNSTASRYSGIRTAQIRTMVYVLSAMCSVFTGILLAGNTARPFLGIGKEYTMWSITAVVIGGTSMAGGSGGYLGSALGAIIIIMLEGLLTVINIPEAGRKIANGLIILFMIMIYYRQNRKR
ncbi:MAG: ABC transporter permease [Sphaerochaetaceae bacterium]|jgi:ribose transport system permease protein|nr:ABC transporter permease [Sphaerochaetaceae bacterium]